MTEHIYLMGFMGSGKSVVGKQLAERLNCPFIDLDEYIHSREGEAIKEIFNNKGESYFRNLEHQCLKKVSSGAYSVIALGGGTPCYDRNWKVLNGKKSIYLKCSLINLTNRLSLEKEERPLLASIKTKRDLYLLIRELLNKRRRFYDKAAYNIWNNVKIPNVVEKIIKMIS